MDYNESAPPPPNPKTKKKNRAAPKPQHIEDSMDDYELPPSAGSGFNAAKAPNSRLPPQGGSIASSNHIRGGSFNSLSRDGLRPFARKNLLDETPETIIGAHVKMKGQLEFTKLLRIDGRFEGALISKGDLIIGPKGVFVGDIKEMGEIVIDGKVIGNINVELVDLRDKAQVFGDVTCKSLRMDPTVVLCGRLNVHPQAPLRIDEAGNTIAPEAEVEDVKVRPQSPDKPDIKISSVSPKQKQAKQGTNQPPSSLASPESHHTSQAKEETNQGENAPELVDNEEFTGGKSDHEPDTTGANDAKDENESDGN